MTTAQTVRDRPTLGDRGMFLVWGPPSYGPRSRVFADELGIDVEFVTSFGRRHAADAVLRYLVQGLRTAYLLWQRRPEVVFVQSPPTPAVLCAQLYAMATRALVVVDAHSGALELPYWTRPRWLRRRLTRHAFATIVTGDHYAEAVRRDGGRPVVIPDVPTPAPVVRRPAPSDAFDVVVISSFAPDEPLEAIAEVAARTPEVTYHVTGDPDRAPGRLPSPPPTNMRLTGYLPDDEYISLIASSDAVMCLTTRDHTMQCGACEALSLSTPLITSDWPILRDYFDEGTVHVGATTDEIHRGVRRMVQEHDELRSGIAHLGARRRAEWGRTRDALVSELLQLADRQPRGSAANRRKTS